MHSLFPPIFKSVERNSISILIDYFEQNIHDFKKIKIFRINPSLKKTVLYFDTWLNTLLSISIYFITYLYLGCIPLIKSRRDC